MFNFQCDMLLQPVVLTQPDFRRQSIRVVKTDPTAGQGEGNSRLKQLKSSLADQD